jgi:small-conductance mechanosensitive channel
VASLVVLAVAALLGWAAGQLWARRRGDDPAAGYWARKFSHYVAGLLAAVALAVVWRTFAGRASVVLGLAAAGIAFAMQEVIGALAGWVNIVSGRVYRAGDRVQLGAVKGDVIDITPLRTKIMEMGSAAKADDTWVEGRQYTGRIVAVSNKMTFTHPVYNYSAAFDFLWEELSVPVYYDSDWEAAEKVLREEAEAASDSAGAREAMARMVRQYPVGAQEVVPRVFVRATDECLVLSARFVVPLRSARSVKDAMIRRVLKRLEELGIPLATATDVNLHLSSPPGSPVE